MPAENAGDSNDRDGRATFVLWLRISMVAPGTGACEASLIKPTTEPNWNWARVMVQQTAAAKTIRVAFRIISPGPIRSWSLFKIARLTPALGRLSACPTHLHRNTGKNACATRNTGKNACATKKYTSRLTAIGASRRICRLPSRMRRSSDPSTGCSSSDGSGYRTLRSGIVGSALRRF